MTTFNTIEELLEILDNNPPLLSAVRNKILTDELIRLPNDFKEFKESTEKFQERTEKFQESTEKNLTEIGTRLDTQQESLTGINTRLDNQQESLTGINTRLDNQQENFSRQNRALDRFRGAYAMEGARRYRRDIARTITHARGNRLLENVVLDDADLNLISVAAQGLDISDTFGDIPERVIFSDFDTADLILKVTENNRDKTEFYVAIEASYTIHDDDLTKSTRVAKLIQRVTGKSAFAVVAGAHINPDVTGIIIQDENAFIRAADPDAALWYEVEVRDMQPDSPR